MTFTRTRSTPANYFFGLFAAIVVIGSIWAWRSQSVALSKNDPSFLYATSNTAFTSPVRPVFDAHLSEADLAFGEQQVRRLVKDRPEMGRDVGPEDAVWRFCVKAFAGAAINQRVYWDGAEPMTGYDSDHTGPYQGASGFIRIRKDEASGARKGQPHPCEELWSMAVFELENIRATSAFDAIFERALRGELDRRSWIRENCRLEHDALLRTARLYESLWMPMAKEKGLRGTPRFWNKDAPVNYNDWIAQYNDPKGYPWDSWGRYYDDDIEPYVKSVKAYEASFPQRVGASSTKTRAIHGN